MNVPLRCLYRKAVDSLNFNRLNITKLNSSN